MLCNSAMICLPLTINLLAFAIERWGKTKEADDKLRYETEMRRTHIVIASGLKEEGDNMAEKLVGQSSID